MSQRPPFESDQLLSRGYLREQQRLHADPRGYGGRGSKWADVVASLITVHGGDGMSVLDYGCGQGTLHPAVLKELEAHVPDPHWRNYDPAREEWNRIPDGQYDLVVCTDVLEHVEEAYVETVLAHLRSLTAPRGELFTVISLVPTEKKLSDGRQAHILLRPIPWWLDMMAGAGFTPRGSDFPNPKPEKQFVQAWSPV